MGNNVVHFRISAGDGLEAITKRFSLWRGDVTLVQLEWKAVNLYECESGTTFHISYLDKEGQWVLLEDEAEVARMASLLAVGDTRKCPITLRMSVEYNY